MRDWLVNSWRFDLLQSKASKSAATQPSAEALFQEIEMVIFQKSAEAIVVKRLP
ncbi:hypothetical protein [Aliikangiella sp. IMCC44359]|uniref:hypothetical protein n=1 Tax=Aliikangiella sp. IMCC44359 TaxID=3459125 RepID=UPI00403AA8FC